MRCSKIFATILTAALGLSFACKKDSDSDTDSDSKNDSDKGTGTLALSENELAAAYPEGMAVTAFPQSVDLTPGQPAAGTLSVDTSLNTFFRLQQGGNTEVADFSKHPKEILDDTTKVLNGEADACFDPQTMNGLTFNNNSVDFCFGFDYGIVSGTLLGAGDQGLVNPALSTATSTAEAKANLEAAILNPDTSGEACMVGTSRIMVRKVVNRVESALKLFQGMLCQAKKDALAEELPAAGEEISLVATFSELDTGPNTATYESATIKRLDDKNERPVYQSKLAFTVQSGATSMPFEINLVHSPGAEGNETYDGVMWIKSQRVDDQNQKTYNAVVSVRYSKTGETFDASNLKFEVRTADVVEDYDPLFANGLVNYNAGADASGNYPGQANDYIENISYFAFDVNPSNYAGKISFWNNPGGNFSEAARGFVFESEQQDDGKLKGCAYAGAYLNTSIRKAVKEDITLKPDGCFTPQLSNGACGAPNDNQGQQIWQQCFAQDENGIYKIDADKVTDDAAGFDILNASEATIPQLSFSGMASFDGVYTP